MSFLGDLFGGGSRNRESTRDEASAGSALSRGLGSFGDAVRSIPGNIARDVRMGTSAGMFANRDRQAENLANRGFSQAEIQDYFARTDATIARNAAEEAARRNEGPGDVMEARRTAQQDVPPEERGPRYRSPFGESALTVAPGKGGRGNVPQEISPEMRREALRIFESQRGAGQVPYQMMPFQQGLGSMPRANVSPAFQYAAQNYGRLGGAQRLMDRPMEMMSVAERQRINEMARGMADMQRPTMSPGKGAGTYQPETVGRVLPLISQMGIGSLFGAGRPRPIA